MEEIKCIGCGAKLQSTDINKPGYIKSELLDREDLDGDKIICYELCRDLKLEIIN